MEEKRRQHLSLHLQALTILFAIIIHFSESLKIIPSPKEIMPSTLTGSPRQILTRRQRKNRSVSEIQYSFCVSFVLYCEGNLVWVLIETPPTEKKKRRLNFRKETKPRGLKSNCDPRHL